jgi:IS605 OrfB family transposase
MLLAHQIRLDPTNTQRTFFAQCVGVSRFAYNWALDEWKSQYAAGEKPHEVPLRQLLNGMKGEQFPWMLDVPKTVPQQAIKNLGTAFQRFFTKLGAYPKRKKKFQQDSARLDNGPVKKGANRRKAAKRRAKAHQRVANIRADFSHKLTTDLSQRFETIVIEDLHVKGMVKNHHLARAISDMGFYEFRRQLSYKVPREGGQLVIAPRFYPSSKTCSGCGHKLDELPLSVREWPCPSCGVVHDRDHNAALNLKSLAGSSPVSACGVESAGPRQVVRVKLSTSKQEANTFVPQG